MSASGGIRSVLRGPGINQLRHELRTPVNAVLGYSEMLLEDAPAHRAMLEEAIDAARAVLAAIEDALTPSIAEVDQRDIDALRDALRPQQRRILRAIDALAATADAASMSADLERIRDAAERLLRIGLPESEAPLRDADGPGLSTDAPTMIVDAPAASLEAALAPESADRGGSRILVVDDVADNRAVLERRLQREGHTVECAENGRDALQRIGARRFDLILLDIMMPEIDGFEVLSRLKRSPETRDIPVIMISALDDLASVVRCIEEGAEDHLTKPFEPVLLRARINASLEKKRFRDREKEYLAQVKTIAEAATAVEEGRYQPASLVQAAMRPDELGRLARVFDGMAAEVRAREDRLRQQVTELRQEIESVRRGGDAGESGDTRLPIGHTLAGRYEIQMVVGFGAMGTVYRALDRDLAEVVAVKVLRPDLLSDASVLDRFKAEVRLARRISHPTVVRTHDFGEHAGVQYLTMEYVEGLTARALLDSRGRLGVAAVLGLAAQLAQALAAAHAQGVIHRDIKPQNLLLDGQGALKVMDFGVSRLATKAGGRRESGLIVGTPAYMAPEQLAGGDVDERVDLYATGVVLFECLTGRVPFQADSPVALVARILQEDPPLASTIDPEIPAALAALIARLLARGRESRPSSAHELLRLLEQIA
ncbi:MAG TPA: response regulator [Vicinamibacterales bacterium]|nr:response regulator [Vicinamibacterales bacterium]